MKVKMSTRKDDYSDDLKEIDEWLTKLFLDPLTSQLDETTFHIEIFETCEDYIIEAILAKYHQKDISVYLNEKKIYIYADGLKKKEKKSRVIEFPFLVTERKVSAYFNDGILEIFISKERWKCGKNRRVPIL